MILTDLYKKSLLTRTLVDSLQAPQTRLHLRGTTGSLSSVLCSSVAVEMNTSNHLIIATNKEEAFYLLNDIENLLEEAEAEIEKKRVLLFPTTYRRPYQTEETDNANMLQRSELDWLIYNKPLEYAQLVLGENL